MGTSERQDARSEQGRGRCGKQDGPSRLGRLDALPALSATARRLTTHPDQSLRRTSHQELQSVGVTAEELGPVREEPTTRVALEADYQRLALPRADSVMARDLTVPSQRPEIRLQSDPFLTRTRYGFRFLLDERSPDTPCWTASSIPRGGSPDSCASESSFRRSSKT